MSSQESFCSLSVAVVFFFVVFLDQQFSFLSASNLKQPVFASSKCSIQERCSKATGVQDEGMQPQEKTYYDYFQFYVACITLDADKYH